MEVSCLSTEEFQIKTEVKLETDQAEREYQDFIKNKKDKIEIPVDIDAKIENLGKEIDSSLKRLSNKLNNNLKISNNTIQDIVKLDTVLKSLKDSINAMDSKNIKIFNVEGFDAKLLDDNINNIENYVKKVEDGYKKLNDAKQKFNETSKTKTEPQIDMSKSLNQLERFQNKLDGLKYNFNKFDINVVGIENIKKIENEIDRIADKARARGSQGLKIETPEMQKEIQNLREQEKLIRKIQTLYSNFQVKKIELGDLIDKSSIDQIENVFRDAFNSISNMKDLKLDFNADALTNAMKNVNREVGKAKDEFLGVRQIANDFKSELASFTIGDMLGDAVTDFARSVGQSYMELDRSMREIKKVAEPDDIDSVGKLNNIRKEAIGIAKDVGMASSEVQNAIASALQAGMGGMRESIEVAKQSMILANVGDMSQDSASKAINTVVNSFRLSPLKEYQVEVGNTVKKTTELKNAMDMMNFAGNNYAIGTDGIAEAMKRGGAVLASYNVSLGDSIGLITATNEALQNPERVGNGLKTIAINLAGMKTSAKDGTMSLNKTAVALKNIAGVDVYADKERGKLKNMVQILDEVQGKWGSLSDAQKKALSEAISGKQQATVFQSLMQNYDAFNQIRGEFSRGEHFQSAEKENAQYVDSLDGKLNKLKETWTDTFTTIVNSNLAYGVLDSLIKVSEAINKIVTALSKMNGGLTGGLFATISMFKNLPQLFNIGGKDSKNTDGIKNNLNELKDTMKGSADSMEEDARRINNSLEMSVETDSTNKKKPSDTLEETLESTKQNAKNQGVEIGVDVGDGLSEGLERSSRNIEAQSNQIGVSFEGGLSRGIEKGKAKVKGFVDTMGNVGTSLLNIGKSALVSFGVGMALEVGLKGVYKLYDSIAHKYENQKRAIEEKTQAIKQESDTHKENLRWMEQNSKRYDELIQKEEQYNKTDRSNWTSEQKAEMEELLGMKEQLANMFPELVAGYDELGNPIIAMTDSMQGLIDKTKEQISLLQTQMVQQKIDTGTNAREEVNKHKLKFGGQTLVDRVSSDFKTFTSDADFYMEKMTSASTNWDSFVQRRQDGINKMAQNQKELNKTLTDYNKLELEIQSGQLAKFQSQGNYEGLKNDQKGKITSLINSLDWGKLNDTQLSNWQNGIDNIINNFPEIGDKASGIITKLNEVNSSFAMNKLSPAEYTKKINALAREFSKLTGMDFKTVKEGFDQAFSFDYKIQDKTEMLKAFGKQLKDVQTDTLANSLSNQYDSADKLQGKIIEVKTQVQAKAFLKDIKTDKNLSQEIKNYVEKSVNDGNYTDVEKQITYTLTEIVKHGGTATKGDEERLQKLLDGKATKKDIELGVKFKDGEKLNTAQIELLKGKGKGIKVANLIDTTGFEGKVKLVNNAFKQIKFGATRKQAFDSIKGSTLTTKTEIDSLAQAVKKIPPSKRTDFVTNYADTFKNVKNVNEGIKKLPKEAKLIYNIGIGNDEKLKSLKRTLDTMPKSVQTDFKMGKIDTSFLDKWNSIKSERKTLLIDYVNNGKINTDLFYDIINNYPDQVDKVVNLIEKGDIDKNKLASIKKLQDLPDETKKKIKLVVDDSEKKKLQEPTTTGEVKVTKHVDKRGNIKANVNTGDAVKAIDSLNKKIGSLKNKKVTVTVATQTARKNLSGLIKRVNQINTALSGIKGKTVTVNTAQARKNISGLIRKTKEFGSKVGNKTITFTANTAQARKNISGLIKRANQYKGKTYHASCIAHTAHAYQKITALIAKCRAYGGKTYHASFIAHTAHAYSKISALVSKARSYGGRTYHASMTLTTRRIEKVIQKTQKAPKQVEPGEMTRVVRTTYANDGIMPIDEPAKEQPSAPPTETTFGAPRTKARAKGSNIDVNDIEGSISKTSKLLNVPVKAMEQAFQHMHQMVDGMIDKVVGKTQKLADVIAKGTVITLTPIVNSVKDIMDSFKFDINRLQELENTISRVAHSIDMLDKKMSNSVGSERIAYLQRQNTELKKRIKLNEELLKQKKREKEVYKQELKKKGLKFTKDDNISNYEETMLKLKREMESLDKTSEKLSENSDKRSEKQQKADEKKRKQIEKRKQEIEELIKLMERFNKIVFGDIFDLESSIVDDANKVEENLLEQKQIQYEKWVVSLESAFKNVNKELQKLNNQLSMVDVQMEHAWGKEKLDLMNKQVELIKKSQQAVKDNLTVMQSAKDSAKGKLMEYGFKFNSNGDIENFVEQMNHLKDTSKEFDTIQGLVDGYFDLYLEQIPEAERELAEFTNKIKDVYKEQLNMTKELEDKIIDMYKKQLEERKKLIDEELKKRLDALKKEQDAYKRAREEQNYKDDFNEQADKVKEIQKQIDLAKRDTSLAGQKKLKDLLKQLEDEKKKLDEITQNRIDQQVDNAFKDEEDRLQQGADDEKDRLDKEFSDEELLKKAQEAIKNGLFIGIDGEVKNLQSALLEYIDKWEEGLSATGALIKSEWITKLVTANDLIKDYAGKLESLGIGNLNTNDIYNRIPSNYTEGKAGTNINYNQPLVVVQGNVDNANIEQIKRTINEAIDRNNREILRKI